MARPPAYLATTLYDTDLGDKDPTWSPELLSRPTTFSRRTAEEFASSLRSCHGPDELDEERFEVIAEVRRELANWHRRIVLQGVGEGDQNILNWADIHNSRLPHCLLDMASDKRIFEGVEDGLEEEEYIHDVYSAVYACACAYLRVIKYSPPRFLDMVKDFLEHLEGLFENLWAQRDPALLDLSPDEVHGWPMEYRLISLAQTADGLYFQCHRDKRRLTTGWTHHVTMFVWMNTSNPYIAMIVWDAFMRAVDLEEPIQPSITGNNRVRQFFNKAIIRNNMKEEFMDTLSFLLFSPSCTDDKILSILGGMWRLRVACFELFDDVEKRSYILLRENCSKACQRQVCLGEGKNPDVVHDIFLLSFWWTTFTTKHMWRFIRPSELPRSRAARVINDFNRIKLLPLIAHFVQFPTDAAAANRSEPLISDVVWLFEVCRVALAFQLREEGAAAAHRGLADMQNTIHSVWDTIWTGLRRLSTERRAVRDDLKPALQAWTRIGELCNVPQEPLEGYIRIQTHREDKKILFKRGCAWEKCLCAEWPEHHMKVCKGCWKAVYCGSRCQKQDWKEGHRVICSRESARVR